MSRLPRIVVPGVPHHVTQRGNRRERIFFRDEDYALYRDLLAEACELNRTEVWAYCLMPNHVHLILVPETVTSLAKAMGETHRRYAGFINARSRQTGHLFQGRFSSVAMDEAHLLAAARYVALNPVKAKLAERAEHWPWSSTKAHFCAQDDELVTVEPLINRVGDFRKFLDIDPEPALITALSEGQSVGRPLMHDSLIREIEIRLGKAILPAKRGRKPSSRAAESQLKLV
jgi:putative transposase